jgi:hypothetical protein
MQIARIIITIVVTACSSPSLSPTPTEVSGASLSGPAAHKDPGMNLNDLLARASRSELTSYNPSFVIDAVNALVPLGQDGALKAIDGFLATQDLVKDPHNGLFLLLRVLFDASPHPPLRLGGSHPSPPTSPSALPRFPIVILDDVPVLLVERYILRGLAEPIADHLALYRTRGKLRAAPLAPARGPDRLAGYQAQYREAYRAEPSAAELAFVKAQLDRMAP